MPYEYVSASDCSDDEEWVENEQTEAWYDEDDEELYEEWVRQCCEKAFENGSRRY